MRRITVLIASALINASTIPGLAAVSTLNKDVDAARAVSDLYERKYNGLMTEEAAATFTAVLTLAIAINNARSTNAKAIRSALLNLNIAKVWDGLRWFLSIHYKFNNKYNTPFWRAARSDTDTSGARTLLDAYQSLAPLHFHSNVSRWKSSHASSMSRSSATTGGCRRVMARVVHGMPLVCALI